MENKETMPGNRKFEMLRDAASFLAEQILLIWKDRLGRIGLVIIFLMILLMQQDNIFL